MDEHDHKPLTRVRVVVGFGIATWAIGFVCVWCLL